MDRKKNISFEEFLIFFGHEIGHRVGNCLDDEIEEEKRADTYGFTAKLAYQFAKQQINKQEITKINLNQIFEIEGKKYIVTEPKSVLNSKNEHGQIVFLLNEIN